MEIVNFGLFKPLNDTGIIFYQNEHQQDWYDLRKGLTNWNEKGDFVDAVYGAWVLVQPEDGSSTDGVVTNVEYDPSRLVPHNKIVVGVDAAPSEIASGMLFQAGAFLPAPPVIEPMPNLSPRQLWLAALEINTTKAQVMAQIGTITDAKLRATLEIELTEPPLQGYVRNSFAVERLREMMGIPVDQFDALWLWAGTL
ncbi:hypothetical protein NXC14_CH02007 [Rhizobium sp. NXC14]|uniref:hypothetical protein n=1 Tax=Rhizobium sp. NXC14 TaxID=1981173 RepID=UPI000A20B92F|nr:hypothetical protein [Rhizobium sp. NXC14]ARO29956.1 hypothetical protein NXC14_CH02007 [Rhizobium sp. NXC14]